MASRQQLTPRVVLRLSLCVFMCCCSVLAPGQLSGSWLYAGGHGTVCSNSQVVLVLVAGLMPEELQDKAAAEQLREVQMQLLAQLAAAHPQALFYSNYFRLVVAGPGHILFHTQL